jgi:sugar phosphate isomerase/epimerase
MKIAISNIAWPAQGFTEFLSLVQDQGIDAVELAPSWIWPEPTEVPDKERERFVRRLDEFGISVIAIHALLFTRRDLGLFRGKKVEEKTVEYLKRLVVLASGLGARWMVFGSPNNRRRGSLPEEEAYKRAACVFRPVADFAAETGPTLLIEPLSARYTDFIHTSTEGIRLVRRVGSPGFQLHLDATSVAEEGGDPREIFSGALPVMKHFHINDPDLAPLGTHAGYHQAMGAALRASGYSGYASIEMRAEPDYRQAVVQSLELAKKYYSHS